MPAPQNPKIYHIVHVDRLPAILAAGGLLSYAAVSQAGEVGTSIGMRHIKERRLRLPLESHPGLMVGSCVPFYFCSRSVMLYMINQQNADLEWRGGQEPIVHLEADLRKTVAWAAAQNRRWAFTLSNAGATYFEDRATLADLDDLDWSAINARYWSSCRSNKQAEFLLEQGFPWPLVERIGVQSRSTGQAVMALLANQAHRPAVNVLPDWYY